MNLRIDTQRMFDRIEALAAIDRRDDGSCCRLALTDADRAGRELVLGWMRDAGLEIRIDGIGNIVGTLMGASPGGPVMTGSHIDTVATGGRYDGVYGVIAGLAVVDALDDADIVTDRQIAVAVFTNEEGARFQPDMMGSLVYAGLLPLDEALAATDRDGIRLGDELVRIGFAGDGTAQGPKPHAFVELHIEQGPIHDREGAVLGAVENLQGISWQEIVVAGVSNHAGTTPMSLRHDAGYCAGRIAVFVRDLCRRMGGAQVATVGAIDLSPNLINVIPREAAVAVDLRNIDDDLLKRAEAELAEFLVTLADEEGVSIKATPLVRTDPVFFDGQIVRAIEDVAAQLGHPIRRMTSGAGHDAQMMASLCPTAMIFVPSIDGISHNPREETAPEHLEIGANMLLQTLIRLACA